MFIFQSKIEKASWGTQGEKSSKKGRFEESWLNNWSTSKSNVKHKKYFLTRGRRLGGYDYSKCLPTDSIFSHVTVNSDSILTHIMVGLGTATIKHNCKYTYLCWGESSVWIPLWSEPVDDLASILREIRGVVKVQQGIRCRLDIYWPGPWVGGLPRWPTDSSLATPSTWASILPIHVLLAVCNQ